MTMEEGRIAYIERLLTRRRAFKAVFMDEKNNLKPDGVIVLRELSAFCYARKPTTKISPKTGMVDSHATLLAEGRREVFLRLIALLGQDEKVNQALNQLEE